jgi:hypothetical protein
MVTATAFIFGGAMVDGKVAVAEVPLTVAATRFPVAAVLLFAPPLTSPRSTARRHLAPERRRRTAW